MKRTPFLLLAGFAVVGTVAIACGDDDAAIPDAAIDSGADARPSPSPSPDGGTTTSDAGQGEDSGVITDGGANLDPDAADEDDAGPCHTLTNSARAQASTCSSQIPAFVGGALVAGKYHLVNIAALGSPSFCGNQFRSVTLTQTMDLVVDGAGVGTAQLITSTGDRPPKTSTLLLDPPDAGSPLSRSALCPPRGAGRTAYSSLERNGKQLLVLELGYGQGQALYRYEKQ